MRTTLVAILLWMQRWLQRRMADEDDDEQTMEYVQHMESTQQSTPIWGGSVPEHIVANHDHEDGYARIMFDYFSNNPVYIGYHFHQRYVPLVSYRTKLSFLYKFVVLLHWRTRSTLCRYRMRKHLFLRIARVVELRKP